VATPLHRVLNFRTGSTVSSCTTAAPDWLGVYALRRFLEVHADGGRLGPWGWTNQHQLTVTSQDSAGRILCRATHELPGWITWLPGC